MFQELNRHRPDPLKHELDTARVYAEVAIREFSLGYPDNARTAQERAANAYQAALDLIPFYPDVALRDKLKSIRDALDRNAIRWQL